MLIAGAHGPPERESLCGMPRDRRTDPRRRAAVDIAIALAELNAGWGDYARALEHFRSADELAGGSLEGRFVSQRDDWERRASLVTR